MGIESVKCEGVKCGNRSTVGRLTLAVCRAKVLFVLKAVHRKRRAVCAERQP